RHAADNASWPASKKLSQRPRWIDYPHGPMKTGARVWTMGRSREDRGRASTCRAGIATMCGIVAYVGNKQVQPLLIEGLKRLEYRGYDSAGLAVMTDQGLKVARSVGRVSVLEDMLANLGGFEGTAGIAHTRWATHGS